jgi:membrane protease YdiL (CAAX protease family)
MSTVASADVPPVVVARDRRTLALAWFGTMAMSSLPAVVLVPVTRTGPGPIYPWLLVAGGLLSAATWVWQPARALRRYFLVMTAVFAVAYVLPPLLSGWTTGRGGALTEALLFRTIFLVLALAMAGFVVKGLGLTREAAFLAIGDMSAPSTIRLPGMRRGPSWAMVGSIATVVLFTMVAGVTWLDSGFGPGSLRRLAQILPLVILCAAFNAFGEEVIYRSGPLATLVGVVGPGQAILMTSVWFGLAHYFNSVPEGAVGVIQSGILALLLGRAMVTTRGLGWPWIIHMALDVVVFASIAMAAG